MPGKMSRNKGHDFEREIVNIARSHGKEAKRSTCSFGVDVTLNGQKVSCKRRAKGLAWAYAELETHDYILFRADRKPILQIKLWRP